MNRLNVGDVVLWRGCFGAAGPRPATVRTIEITDGACKDGLPVPFVSWGMVHDPGCPRRVIVDLDNDHWAYGSQIEALEVRK